MQKKYIILSMNNEGKTKKLVLIAFFSTLSALLMLIEIVVPIVPSFIKMDMSELPVILGGYLLGPANGVVIIILKIVIKLFIKPSSTLFLGEIINFIAGLFYMLPAVLIYKYNKSLKGAIISLSVGTIVSSLVVTVLDYYIVFPLYSILFGMSMDSIIAAGTAINKNIHDLFTLMLISVFPFNLLKYGFTSILTLLLYKHLKNAFKL